MSTTHALGTFFSAALLALASAAPGHAGFNTWTPLGPPGRTVAALVLDPSNPAVLVAASGAGIYRSYDGGHAWRLVHEGSAVTSLARAPLDARRLYAGTFGSVLVSRDGGRSWRSCFLEGIQVNGLAVDPTDPDRVVAVGFSTTGGSDFPVPQVVRSTDGGASWRTRTAAGHNKVDFVAIHPRAPAVVFAGGEGIFRSHDGGDSWREVLPYRGPDGDLRAVSSFAIDPAHPLVLYAGTAAELPAVLHPIWKSEDGGGTWRPAGTGGRTPDADLTGRSVFALAVDPSGAVIAGTSRGVFSSADGGASWRRLDAAFAGPVTSLTVHPLFPRTLYAGTAGFGTAKLIRSAGGDGCAPAEALCLRGGRFHVEVAWRDFTGRGGLARPLRLSDTSGALWFFDRGNVEMVVKVLDGSRFNDRVWFFYGALSNVETTVQVTDVVSHRVRAYHNPAGAFASSGDVEAFPADDLATPPPVPATRHPEAPASARRVRKKQAGDGLCVPSETVLCLGGRFEARVAWRDFSRNTGQGRVAHRTDRAGTFWFFDPDNVELVVKTVDGAAFNGHRWVFYAALSNVAFTLEVRDLSTGRVRLYANPPGTFTSVGDVEAFR